MQPDTTLAFTGERYVPEISGNIQIEHMHRYVYSLALAKGKRVLDIASGEGYGSALLASQAALVVGVDIAEDAVSHARKKYQLPNLEFRLGSCSKIPLADASVDLVVSFETIEHHDEHEQMLAEIKRVLKPAGLVIISSPDKAIYTDKPDYHNPFHVKELYRDEFESLFRAHFKNVIALGQKVMFGSGIIPSCEGAQSAFTSVDLSGTGCRPGLIESTYNLIIASDADLPDTAASFLDIGIDASETVQSWKATVAQRDGDIARLQAELAGLSTQLTGRDAQVAELSTQLTGRDAQVAELSAELAGRDAQIAELSAQLAQRNAQIGELSAQAAEYIYHLDRINAWGWFRLGLSLDKFIRAPFRLIKKQRRNMAVEDRPDAIANTRADADGLKKKVSIDPRGARSNEKSSYRPKVSAIVPNYNHRAFLKQRITSILDQTYENLEVIILDDCSDDGSQDLIKEFCQSYPARIKAIMNDTNSGNVFAQWKKGIDNSDGELIWICESDDFCENDFLEIMVSHLKDRSVNIAFGRIQFSDSNGNLQHGLDGYREGAEEGIWDRPVCRPANKWFANGFGVNNVIANVGGCVWRRQELSQAVWKEASSYTVLGDWFLYCHLAGGGQIAYDPKAVSYFRQHGKNTSVSAFTRPAYYIEHERLMTVLRKQWGVPDNTVEKFYHKVSEQYRYFKKASEGAALEELVGKHRLLQIQRENPHILMAFLGFHVGGGEVFPINLANALHDRGYTVSMMALDTATVNEGMLASLNPGIAVYGSGHVEEMGMDEFLADTGVSIIHSHMLSVDMFLFNKMRMNARIPYVVTLHGSYEAIPIDDGSLLRIIKGVSHWVYLSEKNLEAFKSLPLKSEIFSKLGNAMPFDPRPFPQTRDDLGIPYDAVVFTLAARGIKQKGWEESIIAFMRLRKENPGRKMHLLLCGEGGEPERLARLYKKEPNITFLGYQSRISGLYRMSDCAILPTRFIGESFPLCIIQAMHTGTPIIATRIGEIENMIVKRGDVAGIVIENNDDTEMFVDGLKAAMQAMLDDSLRSSFRVASRKNGAEYSMDALTDKYIDLYKRLISSDKC